MADFQKGDMASFQTIEVKAEGTRTIAYAVDAQGKREDIEFSRGATVLLIKGIQKRFPELSSNHKARPQIYREVHDELNYYGYNYSVERIRKKWNNLLGTYKKMKKDNNLDKPPWEYFEMLSEFLPQDYCMSTNTILPISSPLSTHSQTCKEASSSPSAACTSNSSSEKVEVSPLALGKDIDLGMKRHSIMEKYMEQIKDKDRFEIEYKRRKERRERLKIKALNRISEELHSIATTQCEILKKQDQILEALKS